VTAEQDLEQSGLFSSSGAAWARPGLLIALLAGLSTLSH
jgi:hypothetical protein